MHENSMSLLTEDLPTDALVAIYSYLRATESISCRGVCQKWSGTAGAGTIQVQVRRCLINSSRKITPHDQEDIIGSITLFGRVKKKGHINGGGGDDEGGIGVVTAHSNSIPERIRGHLPSPSSQTSQDMSNTIPAAYAFVCDELSENDRADALNSVMIRCTLTTRHPCNAAIQIENPLAQSPFITIDLSSSSSKFQYGVSEKNKNHTYQTICKEKKVRTLRSSITRIDISCLKHLRVISVGGCGYLRSLLLPKSIQSVDAKGCSELLRIGFPNGCDGSLQSLDLNGCRILKRIDDSLFGVNTADLLCNITHLDMSQLPKEGLLNEEFCIGLQSTNHLQMFSLRYCASDAIITALADSQSARSGQLRLVDIAFSVNVTDESVKLLARNGPALERINMRGCRGITGECYNNIPVYLERRRRRGSGGETGCEDEEMDAFPSSRKGDNLFYFCKK